MMLPYLNILNKNGKKILIHMSQGTYKEDLPMYLGKKLLDQISCVS